MVVPRSYYSAVGSDESNYRIKLNSGRRLSDPSSKSSSHDEAVCRTSGPRSFGREAYGIPEPRTNTGIRVNPSPEKEVRAGFLPE